LTHSGTPTRIRLPSPAGVTDWTYPSAYRRNAPEPARKQITAATFTMATQFQLRIVAILFSRARRLLFQEMIRSFRLIFRDFLATSTPWYL